MTRQTDQRYRRINPVCPPPDKAGAVEERLKQRRAAEQAVREREERYPVLTTANAQEAIDWQTARIAELMQESASYPEKCFACDRKLKPSEWYYKAQTIDGQTVYVGSECYDKIRKAKREGYQSPLGGPRLFTLDINLEWVA